MKKIVFTLLIFSFIPMRFVIAQTEHAGHGSAAQIQEKPEQKEIPGTRSFSKAEFSKLKPGQVCLIHKCKMGACPIVSLDEAAKLGKCPHCGEDLGKIFEAAQETKKAMLEGRAPVTLTAEKQQYLGVKLGKVERRKIAKEISTVGRIAYDPELFTAQEEFKAALEVLSKVEESPLEEPKQISRSNVESIKRRLRLLGLGEEQILKMEKHPHEDTSLILPGSKDGVWVYAPIYEYEMGYIKIGQEISVNVPAFPGKEFKGTIQSLDPVLDPQTRTARVRALLENPGGLLRPEMYANAAINIDLGEGLAVPSEAIFKTGKENIVFVSLGEGRYEPRSVVIGLEGKDFTEIKEGLAEGEGVVTSGNFLIDSESRLQTSAGAMAGHNMSDKGKK